MLALVHSRFRTKSVVTSRVDYHSVPLDGKGKSRKAFPSKQAEFRLQGKDEKSPEELLSSQKNSDKGTGSRDSMALRKD